MKAYGPGLQKSVINKPAEFTVEAKDAGKGPLKVIAQVQHRIHRSQPALQYLDMILETSYCIAVLSSYGTGLVI